MFITVPFVIGIVSAATTSFGLGHARSRGGASNKILVGAKPGTQVIDPHTIIARSIADARANPRGTCDFHLCTSDKAEMTALDGSDGASEQSWPSKSNAAATTLKKLLDGATCKVTSEGPGSWTKLGTRGDVAPSYYPCNAKDQTAYKYSPVSCTTDFSCHSLSDADKARLKGVSEGQASKSLGLEDYHMTD